MAPRLQLHQILEKIMVDTLGEGKAHVYFQRPGNDKMVYPCIVYRRDKSKVEFANNTPYVGTKRYSVTVIDPDPDSELPDKIAALPLTLFDRFYVADELNHDVFNLYF